MAKRYKNNKNFLIIQMNGLEATKLKFGLEREDTYNMCVCGTCNNTCDNDIYYIACLNEVMCKECMEDYCSNMNHFCDNDSLTYEVEHFNNVAHKLGIAETAIYCNKKIYFIDKTINK